VAVKVKLGPIRKMAEKQGAEKTAQVLAGIDAQAGEAILAVREFASGVYPPLLEAEGLTIALGQQVRGFAMPVSIDADNVGRYPRDIEAAVYFSVLESLQNTLKYANASEASVHFADGNGELRFEVSDDGDGFDVGAVEPGSGLNGIADRIDVAGGQVHVESSPGVGTVVRGWVPGSVLAELDSRVAS
jgi:signal transduction histidine kinase